MELPLPHIQRSIHRAVGLLAIVKNISKQLFVLDGRRNPSLCADETTFMGPLQLGWRSRGHSGHLPHHREYAAGQHNVPWSLRVALCAAAAATSSSDSRSCNKPSTMAHWRATSIRLSDADEPPSFRWKTSGASAVVRTSPFNRNF